MPREDKKKNPVLSLRVEEGVRAWFISESFRYRSWNMFFLELKKRYEEREEYELTDDGDDEDSGLVFKSKYNN